MPFTSQNGVLVMPSQTSLDQTSPDLGLESSLLFISSWIWGVPPVGLCLGVNVYKSDVCIQQLDDDFDVLRPDPPNYYTGL